VAADAPLAFWFARLEDVAPDGAVTLVASAGFNGAHRESAREPKALEPGVFVTLDVEMHFTSWVFPKGHRMRLAVSNSQWPMIWPTPYAMTTSLKLGGAEGTRLLLPVVPEGPRPKPNFLPIQEDPDEFPGYETLEDGTTSGYVEIESIDRNPQRHSTRVTATNDNTGRYPWGEHRIVEKVVHEVEDARPEAASLRAEYQTTIKLKDRELRFENQVEIVGDRQNFNYSCVKRLFENGALVREKRWTEAVPRDFQ
jgi:predicted acyl esterase